MPCVMYGSTCLTMSNCTATATVMCFDMIVSCPPHRTRSTHTPIFAHVNRHAQLVFGIPHTHNVFGYVKTHTQLSCTDVHPQLHICPCEITYYDSLPPYSDIPQPHKWRTWLTLYRSPRAGTQDRGCGWSWCWQRRTCPRTTSARHPTGQAVSTWSAKGLITFSSFFTCAHTARNGISWRARAARALSSSQPLSSRAAARNTLPSPVTSSGPVC